MHKFNHAIKHLFAGFSYTKIGVLGVNNISIGAVKAPLVYIPEKLSIERMKKEGVSLYYTYYTMHKWTKEKQDEFCIHCKEDGIHCIFIEYSMPERTIEWLCAWIKYINKIQDYKEISCFIKNGGIEQVLYKHGFSSDFYEREYVSQSILRYGRFL